MGLNEYATSLKNNQTVRNIGMYWLYWLIRFEQFFEKKKETTQNYKEFNIIRIITSRYKKCQLHKSYDFVISIVY